MVIQGLVAVALAATPAPLTSVRSVLELTNQQANQGLPVELEATVTYYQKDTYTLFVQQDGAGIYVAPRVNGELLPGDLILIRGKTQGSFHPVIISDSITLVRHESLPKPVPATFDELIHDKHDAQLVTIRGIIRTADLDTNTAYRSAYMHVLTDGGYISASISHGESLDLKTLLDADVEITGVAGGMFDGKYQVRGILLNVSSIAQMKVLKYADASTNPWTLPITPMDRVLMGYHVIDRTQRVRVHGTITYYLPGAAAVLQDGPKSIWVETLTREPLQVGDVADAIGFPEAHNGFLALARGEVLDSHVQSPVMPVMTTRSELSKSGHIIDLVSVEGKVVSESRGGTQDEYGLLADGELFSVVYRHHGGGEPVPPMKEIPIGSKVRVTGICITEDSNPFDNDVGFDILMRSFDDITVIAKPSMLNVTNLIVIALLLLLLAAAAGAWGWTLKSKVRQQTTAMALRIEAEAAIERRTTKLEQRRSRILEDINTARPLAEIIEEITDMVTFWLDGAPCWCEISDGATLGIPIPQGSGVRLAREPIPGRSGDRLGILFAGLNSAEQADTNPAEALIMGARLAALAIETRRLYSDLTHRSEFDLLTDIHNRFSLDRQLEAQIVEARQKKSVFGIIYIDLDKFKQINDKYGHHIGDLYLQESVLRMKRQLRGGDMLARLGGDEFAALLTSIRGRADIDDIANRLDRCFDPPFNLEGYELRGAASIGTAFFPDDGYTKDTLLNAADASMYAVKNSRRAAAAVSQNLFVMESKTSRS